MTDRRVLYATAVYDQDEIDRSGVFSRSSSAMRVSIVLANWPNCAAGGSDRPIPAKFIDAEERSRRYGKINPALTLCK